MGVPLFVDRNTAAEMDAKSPEFSVSCVGATTTVNTLLGFEVEIDQETLKVPEFAEKVLAEESMPT